MPYAVVHQFELGHYSEWEAVDAIFYHLFRRLYNDHSNSRNLG
jgi:hypothetical protein